MNKVKSLAMIGPVAAVILSLTAGTASANSMDAKSNVERCTNTGGQCVLLQAYSTYSSTQIPNMRIHKKPPTAEA
jgi:hypothetical protein